MQKQLAENTHTHIYEGNLIKYFVICFMQMKHVIITEWENVRSHLVWHNIQLMLAILT